MHVEVGAAACGGARRRRFCAGAGLPSRGALGRDELLDSNADRPVAGRGDAADLEAPQRPRGAEARQRAARGHPEQALRGRRPRPQARQARCSARKEPVEAVVSVLAPPSDVLLGSSSGASGSWVPAS